MTQTPSTIVTRAEASRRLLEAAHHIFANSIDDLALLATVGSVLTGAHEELDFAPITSDASHPLHGMIGPGDRELFALWFNFLKHGARDVKSPGELDFAFLGEEPERDAHLYSLIWKAALHHIAAYETTSELIDAILLTGFTLLAFDDGDEDFDPEAHAFLTKNIRNIAAQWYSRHARAETNGIDLAAADGNAWAAVSSHITTLFASMPKKPDRSKKARSLTSRG